MRAFVFVWVFLAMIQGCVSQNMGASTDSNLTVGKVQKEIKIGMSSAEVVQILGSPNIVTTDEKRREVWVYDKVASDVVQKSSSGWVFAVIAGGGSSTASSSRSQRTLTVVIKFDEDDKVRDFSYHTSKF